jgi:hypothetical protein
MGKTIIIDAKLFNSQTKEFSRTNILLAGHKILGLGYIPDDDDVEAELLNVNGSFIIPFLTDSYPLTEDIKHIAHKNGITNSIDFSDILCEKSGVQLKEALQKAEKEKTKLYCILQNLDQDLNTYMDAKNRNNKLCAGISVTLLIKQNNSVIKDLVKKNIIQTIVCGENNYENFVETAFSYLKKYFEIPDILNLMSYNPFHIAEQKVPSFTLLSKPSITIVDPKKTPILQCVIIKGEVVVDNTK